MRIRVYDCKLNKTIQEPQRNRNDGLYRLRKGLGRRLDCKKKYLREKAFEFGYRCKDAKR